MNLDNMTIEELFRLHEETGKRLGFYDLCTVSVDDVRDRFQDMIDDGDPITMPSEETIRQALAYIRRKHDGEDWFYAVGWATELVQKSEAEKLTEGV